VVGEKCEVVLSWHVSLKQQIHALVDELPDDSPLLVEVREMLRMSHAIGEAMEDVRAGRTYGAEEFMAKVQARAARGSWEDFDRIMARVPDAPPVSGDQR